MHHEIFNRKMHQAHIIIFKYYQSMFDPFNDIILCNFLKNLMTIKPTEREK